MYVYTSYQSKLFRNHYSFPLSAKSVILYENIHLTDLLVVVYSLPLAKVYLYHLTVSRNPQSIPFILYKHIMQNKNSDTFKWQNTRFNKEMFTHAHMVMPVEPPAS